MSERLSLAKVPTFSTAVLKAFSVWDAISVKRSSSYRSSTVFFRVSVIVMVVGLLMSSQTASGRHLFKRATGEFASRGRVI